MSKPNHRTLAIQIVYEVVYKHNNLSELFVQKFRKNNPIELISSVKSLSYETIRHYLYLHDRWQHHVRKRPKDKIVRVILTVALAESIFQNKPDHVVVNEAINAAKKLKKQWATGLINSTLRKSLATENDTPQNEESAYAHPQWWINLIKQDWPDYWQQILKANNQKPPLWVRTRTAISEYIEKHIFINNAFIVNSQDITKNKDFNNGRLSVQDASAQLAAHILNPQKHEKILDACAAPGGKTGHLLELEPSLKLDALELYENRAKKIKENLNRLKLKANIKVADASLVEQWFNGTNYDKVLLDVPCSASGIIRRQVDIKFNRKHEDIVKICQDQQRLLENVATTLKNKGRLLYVTCSIFKQENADQIKKFLKKHPEFKEIKLDFPFSTTCEYGIQILTGTYNMDGFYYCYLEKNEA